jgi:hypothetical protein
MSYIFTFMLSPLLPGGPAPHVLGEEDNRAVFFEPLAAANENLQAIRTHGNLS